MTLQRFLGKYSTSFLVDFIYIFQITSAKRDILRAFVHTIVQLIICSTEYRLNIFLNFCFMALQKGWLDTKFDAVRSDNAYIRKLIPIWGRVPVDGKLMEEMRNICSFTLDSEDREEYTHQEKPIMIITEKWGNTWELVW